jgi:hypothetical protein
MSVIRLVPKTKEIPKYRRVIDGFVYDTETASVVYRHDSSDDPWDECRIYEYGLMQNMWGHYFCYYWDDSMDGSGEVTPLDKLGAMKWMERHCNWLIESVFGKFHEAGEGPAYTSKDEP